MPVDTADDSHGFRICSVYALACLSKDDMMTVASLLAAKGNARIADLADQEGTPERVVPPRDVGSAGRAGLVRIAGEQLAGSLIFTASVPFDLMANVEVNVECTQRECLDRCLNYIEIAREELSTLVSRYDVECVTVVTSAAQLADFKSVADERHLKELQSASDVLIYEAPYPHDCLLIFSTSEDIASETQTALQNLYRIKGGAQHLNRALARHLREVVMPLRKSINEYLRESRELSPSRKLDLIRPLRNEIFEIQGVHEDLMNEFENLLEYEVLYLQPASDMAPRMPSLAREMDFEYLRPLKLLRNRVDTLFRGSSGYVDGIVSTVYADASLGLTRRIRLLAYVQAAVAIILFTVTVVQVISIFIR